MKTGEPIESPISDPLCDFMSLFRFKFDDASQKVPGMADGLMFVSGQSVNRFVRPSLYVLIQSIY